MSIKNPEVKTTVIYLAGKYNKSGVVVGRFQSYEPQEETQNEDGTTTLSPLKINIVVGNKVVSSYESDAYSSFAAAETAALKQATAKIEADKARLEASMALLGDPDALYRVETPVT
jgi:hypothetical protein